MLGIKNLNIQKESCESFQLCYLTYFFSPFIFNISENIMRLVLSVLNIMKEMVTVPLLFFLSLFSQ